MVPSIKECKSFASLLDLLKHEFPGLNIIEDDGGRIYVDSFSEDNIIGKRLNIPLFYHCPACGYVNGEPKSDVKFPRSDLEEGLSEMGVYCSICSSPVNKF